MKNYKLHSRDKETEGQKHDKLREPENKGQNYAPNSNPVFLPDSKFDFFFKGKVKDTHRR